MHGRDGMVVVLPPDRPYTLRSRHLSQLLSRHHSRRMNHHPLIQLLAHMHLGFVQCGYDLYTPCRHNTSSLDTSHYKKVALLEQY